MSDGTETVAVPPEEITPPVETLPPAPDAPEAGPPEGTLAALVEDFARFTRRYGTEHVLELTNELIDCASMLEVDAGVRRFEDWIAANRAP